MTDRSLRRPNLFLLGAPKCGTTAMQYYLGQHPEIFVPAEKPPRFFATDFSGPNQVPSTEYLQHFWRARMERYVADCSVWNLASREAVGNIARWDRDARAIVMLRNPVEVLFALHNEYLWEGVEDAPTLAEALDREAARRNGREIPAGAHFRNTSFFPELLQYRDAVRFTSQVARAREHLGDDRLLIVLHDDLKRDTSETFARVCRFLDIEVPEQLDLRRINERKRTRFRFVQRYLLNPPRWVSNVSGWVLGPDVKSRLYRTLRRSNTRPATAQERAPDESLKRQLLDEFREEIARLGTMIGRDLSHWHS